MSVESRRCFFNTGSTFFISLYFCLFHPGRTDGPNVASQSSPPNLASASPLLSLTRWVPGAPASCFVGINSTFEKNVCLLLQAGALVHIYTDGSVLLTHGGTEMGQGLHTKMVQVPQSFNSVILSCQKFPFLLHNFQRFSAFSESVWCLVSGGQQSSGDPLFKDPHLRDKHQHGAQHQPYRCLGLLGSERSRRAERLRDPRPASGAIQDQEPQRIVGGLGERE